MHAITYRRHQTCYLRKHATSAPAEFGGEIQSREIEPVRRSFCRRRSCTCTEVALLAPSSNNLGSVRTCTSAAPQPVSLLVLGAVFVCAHNNRLTLSRCLGLGASKSGLPTQSLPNMDEVPRPTGVRRKGILELIVLPEVKSPFGISVKVFRIVR